MGTDRLPRIGYSELKNTLKVAEQLFLELHEEPNKRKKVALAWKAGEGLKQIKSRLEHGNWGAWKEVAEKALKKRLPERSVRTLEWYMLIAGGFDSGEDAAKIARPPTEAHRIASERKKAERNGIPFILPSRPFDSEKDLKHALRSSITEVESGLVIADGGRERRLSDGQQIDITAQDTEGNLVAIEVKVGKANGSAFAQLLDYMRIFQTNDGNTPARGILVALEFAPRVERLAKWEPNMTLKAYRYGSGQFSFQDR